MSGPSKPAASPSPGDRRSAPQGSGLAGSTEPVIEPPEDSAAGEEDPGAALDEMVRPTAPSAEPPKAPGPKPG
jgi:hypothetical protein